MNKLVIAVVALCFATVAKVQAEELPGFRVAQFDADDTYDPFADYSEFDQAQEEEEDINFFRNGRFVTVGFTGGLRGMTGGMGEIYKPSTSFGLFLSYFFDLRFALQFSFLTSDHNLSVKGYNGNTATGTAGITSFNLDVKYYINTQNVTKGLAAFNPYILGGFARVDRTVTISNQDLQGFAKEGAMGFNLGAGIELPMMQNKMFFGAQALYQMVNFRDENTEIRFNNSSTGTGKYPNGDIYTVLAIIGVNF
jgi:hypothetical protein